MALFKNIKDLETNIISDDIKYYTGSNPLSLTPEYLILKEHRKILGIGIQERKHIPEIYISTNSSRLYEKTKSILGELEIKHDGIITKALEQIHRADHKFTKLLKERFYMKAENEGLPSRSEGWRIMNSMSALYITSNNFRFYIGKIFFIPGKESYKFVNTHEVNNILLDTEITNKVLDIPSMFIGQISQK